jgi:NAD(P)-dependent dehydrogenase (short-subunit alcohol dehydrogenase family)
MVAETVEAFGGLDILVTNMGGPPYGSAAERSDEEWEDAFDLVTLSVIRLARAALPHLRAAQGGRIINFSDWVAASGRPRYPGFVPYYVAKRGIIGLTEALALELAGDRILVNAIAPGPIVAPPGTTADEYAAVERTTPLGRWGGEAEIVKAVMFLLESDFVTGETVRVDGGRHVR